MTPKTYSIRSMRGFLEKLNRWDDAYYYTDEKQATLKVSYGYDTQDGGLLMSIAVYPVC